MLELKGISKSFDEQLVLDSVSLTIGDGEVVALLGPSGSGKTTLLRIIAGLERADEGEVILEGRNLARAAVHDRGFGMVFQDYALFPHKNVAQNVAFGLRMRAWKAEAARARVDELLGLVGLEGFGERPVHELSGGEQQRVALARALAPGPRLLLLDEPLGALDHALRERLLGELRSILRGAGDLSEDPGSITAIYVTHDQAEAFAVADRVALLRSGRLEQVDTPVALFRQPRTAFVARFLGMENLLAGRMVQTEPPLFACALGRLELDARNAPAEGADQDCLLLVRPDAGHLLGAGEQARNVVEGEIASVSFRGRYQEATVAPAKGEALSLELEFEPGVRLPDVGEPVRLALKPEALILVEAEREAQAPDQPALEEP